MPQLDSHRYDNLVRRMINCWCPLDASRIPKLTIRPGEQSQIDRRGSLTAVILEVTILSEIRRPVILRDVEIEWPWFDPSFAWLSAPHPRQPYYTFPGFGWKFPRRNVLNDGLPRLRVVRFVPLTGFFGQVRMTFPTNLIGRLWRSV